jgi:glutamate 5-kinase
VKPYTTSKIESITKVITITKVAAADLASYSNTNDHVFIANSNKSAHLREILNGEIISTRVEVTRTGVLSPIDAYEVFNQLELAKQRGEAYTPIAELLNK